MYPIFLKVALQNAIFIFTIMLVYFVFSWRNTFLHLWVRNKEIFHSFHLVKNNTTRETFGRLIFIAILTK